MTKQEQEQHDLFLGLFVANEESLRGFIRALVPTREDAQEIMQEVAAVLWRKFEALESPADFRRWAFGVARLEVMTFRRDQARDRHLFDEDVLNMLAAEADESADLLATQRDILEGCLKKLPASQQVLVTSVYQHGQRVDHLAEKLGRTPMSLYKLIHRIRVALMECVARELAREAH